MPLYTDPYDLATEDVPSEIDALAKWSGGVPGYSYTDELWFIDIYTLEGTMRANPGAYIIEGVSGEFYPCAGDIFEQTYEEIE